MNQYKNEYKIKALKKVFPPHFLPLSFKNMKSCTNLLNGQMDKVMYKSKKNIYIYLHCALAVGEVLPCFYRTCAKASCEERVDLV